MIAISIHTICLLKSCWT